MHVDGSGTELLSSQTMEEVLYQAYSDPATMLLKEPLPDSQGAFKLLRNTVTVLALILSSMNDVKESLCSRRVRHYHPKARPPECLVPVVAKETEP